MIIENPSKIPSALAEEMFGDSSANLPQVVRMGEGKIMSGFFEGENGVDTLEVVPLKGWEATWSDNQWIYEPIFRCNIFPSQLLPILSKGAEMKDLTFLEIDQTVMELEGTRAMMQISREGVFPFSFSGTPEQCLRAANSVRSRLLI